MFPSQRTKTPFYQVKFDGWPGNFIQSIRKIPMKKIELFFITNILINYVFFGVSVINIYCVNAISTCIVV